MLSSLSPFPPVPFLSKIAHYKGHDIGDLGRKYPELLSEDKLKNFANILDCLKERHLGPFPKKGLQDLVKSKLGKYLFKCIDHQYWGVPLDELVGHVIYAATDVYALLLLDRLPAQDATPSAAPAAGAQSSAPPGGSDRQADEMQAGDVWRPRMASEEDMRLINAANRNRDECDASHTRAWYTHRETVEANLQETFPDFVLEDVPADHHCLFHCLCRQLRAILERRGAEVACIENQRSLRGALVDEFKDGSEL